MSDLPSRILFVVSNLGVNAATGTPVGYWLPELAQPWWQFRQKGYALTIASPAGGPVIHDQASDPDGGRFGNPDDLISLGFKAAASPQAQLAATVPLDEVAAAEYDAIFVVGGLGPPTTFATDDRLASLFAEFWLSGKVAATICHGAVVLLRARLPDGRFLAEGRRWTGYTNAEEDVIDRVMGVPFQPFRIEDEARRIPATRFEQGPPFRPFVVTDGRLVTGQQGSSGLATAQAVVAVLESLK